MANIIVAEQEENACRCQKWGFQKYWAVDPIRPESKGGGSIGQPANALQAMSLFLRRIARR